MYGLLYIVTLNTLVVISNSEVLSTFMTLVDVTTCIDIPLAHDRSITAMHYGIASPFKNILNQFSVTEWSNTAPSDHSFSQTNQF